MKLIVCVSDYWRNRHIYNRPLTDHIELLSGGEGSPPAKPQNFKRLTMEVDAVTGNYVLRELLQQSTLRSWLLDVRNVRLVWLILCAPEHCPIDYKWSRMLAKGLYQRIQFERLLCWLSTLGGGYSSLGDQFEYFAKTAGVISLQQLAIGLRLGDVDLQARCKLFYSISLIQRGHLRSAKYLIRNQYRYANTKQRTHDIRLIRMCLGVWQRLCYEYQLRLEMSLNGKCQTEFEYGMKSL